MKPILAFLRLLRRPQAPDHTHHCVNNVTNIIPKPQLVRAHQPILSTQRQQIHAAMSIRRVFMVDKDLGRRGGRKAEHAKRMLRVKVGHTSETVIDTRV